MTQKKRRRRSERQHPTTVYIRSSVLLVLTAAIVYVALTATKGLPGQSHYAVKAQFADAKNIVKNSDVWIAGRRVGSVTGGEASSHTATLDLQLESRYGPLRSSTTARLRYTSLLGALVVELTPGTTGAELPDGGTIPTSQTSSASQTADVLSALDDKRRPELGTTLRTLGQGFYGQGQGLNDALGQASTLLTNARRTSDGILARPGAAGRLFPSLEQLSSAADPVREDIARGFAPEARVLDTIDDSRVELEQLLQTAPASLNGLREGLQRADPLLDQVAGFSRATIEALDGATPSLRQSAALLRDARQPLARLRPVITNARKSVDPVLGLTGQADRIIERSREALQSPLPFLKAFNDRRCDLLSWGRNWRSMLGLSPVGSPVRNSDVGPLTGLRVQVQQIGTDQQILGRPPVNRRGINAYPAPCTADQDGAQ